jgi:D-beta-D-heptose 7-phosphate kinase/D-beta-D-heptose 1-phosphate adenosyltransferase
VNQPLKVAPALPRLTEPDDLAKILDDLRAAGRRIVFTNGVFDLIHPGHVRFLREARSLGDLLVVALNSDASVRRIKGEKRPILPLVERGKILASFECVDYVTWFDEDTPDVIIRLLRPDVLVKGADYTLDNIVGRDFVESRGGIVRALKFNNGFSSTAVIERILRSAGK